MTLEEMEKMLAELAKSQKAMMDNQAAFQTQMTQALTSSQGTLTAAIQGMSEKLTRSGGQEEELDDDVEMPDDATLEAMPRSKLIELIGSGMDKRMKALEKKLGGDIAKTRHDTNRERIQREVDSLKSEKADFDDWRDEMRVLVKKNPMLTVQEAYILARSGDNKKAIELDAKYKKAADDEAAARGEDEKSGKAKGGFGGMRPGTGERRSTKTDMSKEDAAEAAWNEIFGDNAEELLSGDIPNGAEQAA